MMFSDLQLLHHKIANSLDAKVSKIDKYIKIHFVK